MAAAKVAKAGIKREKDWLYFLDRRGNVSRVRRAEGGGKARKGTTQVVAKVGVQKEDGYLYFIDKDGDVARAKMVRRGKGTRRKAAKKSTARRRAR
jgi:hypothetical protein